MNTYINGVLFEKAKVHTTTYKHCGDKKFPVYVIIDEVEEIILFEEVVLNTLRNKDDALYVIIDNVKYFGYYISKLEDEYYLISIDNVNYREEVRNEFLDKHMLKKENRKCQ